MGQVTSAPLCGGCDNNSQVDRRNETYLEQHPHSSKISTMNQYPNVVDSTIHPRTYFAESNENGEHYYNNNNNNNSAYKHPFNEDNSNRLASMYFGGPTTVEYQQSQSAIQQQQYQQPRQIQAQSTFKDSQPNKKSLDKTVIEEQFYEDTQQQQQQTSQLGPSHSQYSSHLQQQQQQQHHQLGSSSSGPKVNQSPNTALQSKDQIQHNPQVSAFNARDINAANSQVGLSKLNNNLQQQQSHMTQSQQQSQMYKDRVQKLAEIVSFAPMLKLQVLSSANLPKHSVITINAQGVLHGQRNEFDGYTYFGCKKKAKRANKLVRQTAVINDFIIPATDPIQAKEQRGRQFQIKYDIPNNFYTILDLGVGFGAFKKLNANIPHVLRNNELVNFGLTLATVKFFERGFSQTRTLPQSAFEIKENMIMAVQFHGGNSNGELYHLDPNEIQIATIGRSDACTLTFKDKLISKVQCMLSFHTNKGWILRDGEAGEPSTNGTWVYLQKEEQIVDGMVFKANQTAFQASIINQQ